MFGLRKVYKMPSQKNRRWWSRWLPFGGRRVSPVVQQQPQQFVAVADSWFGVPKGQLLCMLGPNGAGKTTSINCLIGEHHADHFPTHTSTGILSLMTWQSQ